MFFVAYVGCVLLAILLKTNKKARRTVAVIIVGGVLFAMYFLVGWGLL